MFWCCPGQHKDLGRSSCVAFVWQWKRFYTGSLRLCSWHEQQNSPLKGQLQSSLSESSPLQGLFSRVSLPKADWRALFDHLALVTTFAWVLLCPLQSFSLIPCIRAVPHSGSQAFPSNAVCISSYYQEIWYQKVSVHPLVLFPPFFFMCLEKATNLIKYIRSGKGVEALEILCVQRCGAINIVLSKHCR